PQGKTDPRFATVRSKEANWQALLEIIESWTSRRSGKECERTLMSAGVPCARYRTVGDALGDPQIETRKLLTGLSSNGEGFKVANPAYQLSRSRMVARQKLPRLGEDTKQVLKDVLGKSDQEIESLIEGGVVGVL
ncbi:MAG: CoA transferase, partial [Roseiarcus sp.]